MGDRIQEGGSMTDKVGIIGRKDLVLAEVRDTFELVQDTIKGCAFRWHGRPTSFDAWIQGPDCIAIRIMFVSPDSRGEWSDMDWDKRASKRIGEEYPVTIPPPTEPMRQYGPWYHEPYQKFQTEQDILGFLALMIMEIGAHEALEWFRHDGEMVLDPHDRDASLSFHIAHSTKPWLTGHKASW